jgi:cell wall-associated NlpC family hydrolase
MLESTVSSQPDADERAADLLARLLTDPDFRASFRRDPSGACEAYGRPDLAHELAGGGKALFTLEIRESRSSLAGALMAAAAEGGQAAESLAQLHHQGALNDDAAHVVGQALTSTGLSVAQSSAAAGPFAGRGLFTAWDPSTAVNAPGVDWVAVRPDKLTAALADQIRGSGKRLIIWEDGASQAGVDAVNAYGASGYIAQAEGPGQLAAAEAIAGNIHVPKAIVTNNFADHLPNDWVALVEAYQNADPNSTPARVVADALNRGARVAIPILGTYDASAEQPGVGTKIPLSEYADELKALRLPGVGAYMAESMSPDELAAFGKLDFAGAASSLDPVAGADNLPPDVVAGGAGGAGTPLPVPDPNLPSTPLPPPDHVPPVHAATPPSPAPPATTPPTPTPPTPSGGPSIDRAAQHLDRAPAQPAQPAEPVQPVQPVEPVQPVGAVDLSALAGEAPAASPGHPSVVVAALGHSVSPQGQHSTLQFMPQVDEAHNALAAPAGSFDTYPGDNASPGAIAAWMGVQAHRAGLPAELPVMAGLTESGLRNLNYGDRDSVGFFQMRTSVWGDRYPDFGRHPEQQLKWFIDSALDVKRQWLAQGRGADLQDPSKFGDWVADVERPAVEYRSRYADHLREAQQLLRANGPGAGGAVAGAVLPPAGGSGPQVDIAPSIAGGVRAEDVAVTSPVAAGNGLYQMTIDGIPATGSPAALRAVAVAFSYKGTPYDWGGASPGTGFDCSGLMQWSWKQAGFDISRVTYTQVHDGAAVEPDYAHLEAGDLLFFRDASGDNHHVGMYVGNHMFIQAPHTGDVVKVSSLDEPYYKEQFFAARRIGGAGSVAAPGGPDPLAGLAAEPQQPAAAALAGAAEPAVAAPAASPGHLSAVLAALGAEHRDAAPAHNTVQFLPTIDEESAKSRS